MPKTHIRRNLSPDFKQNIEKAITMISPDQDEIEVPDSGGQMLVRRDSEAERKREGLIKKAKCIPYKSNGNEFLVCVR